MSVKKYRWYLIMVMLVLIIAGALFYLYFSEPKDDYRDGTLVQNQYVSGEEPA